MAGLGHWYIELKKQAFWRGVPHTWVNRYVMSGGDPTGTDAESVIGALHDIEDVLFPTEASGNGVGFVVGRAYASTGGPPFAEVAYNASEASGSATGFTGGSHGGVTATWAETLETCLLIETLMEGLSSRGKPIYNRKYFRGINAGPQESIGSTPINSAYIAAVNTIVKPWQTGMGASSWIVVGSGGRLPAAAPTVHPWQVAHQVPRGKKRKVVTTSGGGLISDLLSAAEKAALDAIDSVL